jgi:hypothetical protein
MKRSILQPLTIGIGVGVILLGGAIAYSYITGRVWGTGLVGRRTDLLVAYISKPYLSHSGLMKLGLCGSWIVVLELSGVNAIFQKAWSYMYIYVGVRMW